MNAKELAEQIMAEAMKTHGPKPKSRIPEPKPEPPKLELVSEAEPVVDLEAARSTNRRREAKLLAEEKRQIREANQHLLNYRKRHGRMPPNSVEEELRRREEAEQIRRQSIIDYHGEMKLFHEEAERQFRENDPLGLWS